MTPQSKSNPPEEDTMDTTTDRYEITQVRDSKGKARGWVIRDTERQAPVAVDGRTLTLGKRDEAEEALAALLEGELDGYDYDAEDHGTDPAWLSELTTVKVPQLTDAQLADALRRAVEAKDRKLVKAIQYEQGRRGSDEEQAPAGLSELEVEAMTEEPPAEPKKRRGTRVRLGESTGDPAVKYDPAERFPEHADAIKQVRKDVAKLRRELEKATPEGEKKATEVNAEVNRQLAELYAAGLPITALGALLGVSASAARSRAIRAAGHLNIDVSSRTTAEGGASVNRQGSTVDVVPFTEVTAKVAGRYGQKLVDLHKQLAEAHKAGDEDAFNGAMYDAMTQGISIVALGQLIGVSASAARSRAVRYANRKGLTLPGKDDRKAARIALAGSLAEQG